MSPPHDFCHNAGDLSSVRVGRYRLTLGARCEAHQNASTTPHSGGGGGGADGGSCPARTPRRGWALEPFCENVA